MVEDEDDELLEMDLDDDEFTVFCVLHNRPGCVECADLEHWSTDRNDW